jgi:2-polyprenyl-3-methyl-5-hydroxy-6-metoxy-1,4-benzoquinol methylase
MDAQYALNYRELYEKHWWWRARERFILATLKGLRSQGSWDSILDVGCGEGLFFDCLKELGEVEGVETNPSLVTHENRWKQQIYVSTFDAMFQTNKQYSLILMLDVLEHLPNPMVCLRRAEDLLGPAGNLLITVPAFSCLWTTHDELNHHVSRFTKKTLSELISRTALKIHNLRYFFHWMFPVKLLIHCKEMCFRTDPSIPEVPAYHINAVLYRLSILEQKLFSARALPFGSSLLAVCTKQ